MRLLPETFALDGFTFRLLKREGKVALFEKMAPWSDRKFYEVVIVQTHEPTTFPTGQTYPARESMPHSEQWGQAGWSYSDLAMAEQKVEDLVKRAARVPESQ